MDWREYRIEITLFDQGAHLEFFNTVNLITWYCDIETSSVWEFTGHCLRELKNLSVWLQDLLHDSEAKFSFNEQDRQAELSFTIKGRYEAHSYSHRLSKLPVSEAVGFGKKFEAQDLRIAALEKEVESFRSLFATLQPIVAESFPCLSQHLSVTHMLPSGVTKSFFYVPGTGWKGHLGWRSTAWLDRVSSLDIVAASGSLPEQQPIYSMFMVWIFWARDGTAYYHIYRTAQSSKHGQGISSDRLPEPLPPSPVVVPLKKKKTDYGWIIRRF